MGGSRVHLDSEESVSDLNHLEEAGTSANDKTREVTQGSDNKDMTLTPDSNSTMRSMPSPILVHSHKLVKEDTLQRYTDPTKSQTAKAKRQMERGSSLKLRRSLPKVVERNKRSPSLRRSSPTKIPEDIDTNLLLRRQGHLPKLRIDQRSSAIDELDSLSNDQDQFPKDMDDFTNSGSDTNNSNSNLVYSMAPIATNTSLTTKNPAQIDTEDVTERRTEDSNLNRSNSEPLSVHIPSYPSAYLSAYSGYQSVDGQSSYSVPFTPILTSLLAEYTTITDEIDTTCMINRSPPRSPTSAVPYSSSDPAWDDEKLGNQASISEKIALKQAEEIEHRKMERVIRKRLRQISQDESGSTNDIARLVRRRYAWIV